MIDINLIEEYKKSVCELADKLPQWNSEQKDRVYKAAFSSLFEETGELSGVISKYRTRTNKQGIDLYNTKIEDIPSDLLEEIKYKFTDESSDVIWLLTAICHVLINEGIGLFTRLEAAKYLNTEISLEDALFSTIGAIYILYVSNKFEENNKIILYRGLSEIIDAFGVFLVKLKEEYNITIEDILKLNMKKLDSRYDETGKRVDGK